MADMLRRRGVAVFRRLDADVMTYLREAIQRALLAEPVKQECTEVEPATATT